VAERLPVHRPAASRPVRLHIHAGQLHGLVHRLPGIATPDQIFDIAVARSEEIILGSLWP
jgi:hypothetical protein